MPEELAYIDTFWGISPFFQPNEKVNLEFGDAGQIIDARIVNFHLVSGKHKYDVDVHYLPGEEEILHKTRLYNVDERVVWNERSGRKSG